MKPYFHIIRWENLLVLALIQWLILHAVVFPLLHTFGFDTSPYATLYWLLILSTLLITAGGYVINDYFDVKIDRINRPERIVVGEKISLKSTMLYYQILTGLGTAIGLVVAFLSKSFTLGFIFVLTPGLLWFYSASYKRQFIVGNLIVSLSVALAVFIVGMPAVALLKLNYGDLLVQTPIPKTIYGWTGGFAGFAFLLTWMREIIKDMADIEGDREMECRTMPIKWGAKKTKLFLYGLILLTIVVLFFAEHYFVSFENNITARYIIFGLCLPLSALGYMVFKAKTPAEYRHASTLSTYIMLIGILYSVVFYYLLAQKFGISLFGLFIVT